MFYIRKKIIFSLISSLMILSLLACSSALTSTPVSPGQVSFKVGCDQFMKDNHLTRTVRVRQGELLLVTLCSNATTGFQWSQSAQIYDESILEQVEHIFSAPKKSIAGAAGTEEWTFNTFNKGTTIVVWEYSRPWTGGEKRAWSLSATVIVH